MKTDAAARKYRLFVASEALCRVLPRRFNYWISLRVADALYRRDRRGRAAVKSNLRRILEFQGRSSSDEELELMARRTFQSFGKYLVDFFSYSAMKGVRIDRLVDVGNRELLDEMSAARGGLLVTAHLGNWELGGAIIASMGYPVTAVVLEQPEKRLDKLFQSYRQKRGLRVVHLGGAARDLIHALRRKEFVALLADRDYTLRSHPVRFFGAPAYLPRGPAWLSRRCRVPIMPGFMLRKEGDRFDLRLCPLINRDGSMGEDEIHAELCRALEGAIISAPTQWFMFEDLWDGKPYGLHASQETP